MYFAVVDKSPYLAASMCRAMPFSISMTLILWLKTNRNVVYFGLYSYRQRVRVITLFLNIFSYCFCMLSEFAKVFEDFERKIWRLQVAHFYNAARALSSPTRCFQFSTNLDNDFFRYLWYWLMSFSVALVKFHWFGINWHVFNQSECSFWFLRWEKVTKRERITDIG